MIGQLSTEKLCKIAQLISSRAEVCKARQSGSGLSFFLSILNLLRVLYSLSSYMVHCLLFYCALIICHTLFCGTKFSEYVKSSKSLFSQVSFSWNPPLPSFQLDKLLSRPILVPGILEPSLISFTGCVACFSLSLFAARKRTVCCSTSSSNFLFFLPQTLSNSIHHLDIEF